jgi:predicted phage terminase large subunit-like protein
VIADDLEDTTTVQNERERNARKEWVNRTVLKAGTDNTVFFFVGNKVHNDGVIAMLQANPLFRKRVYKAVLGWAERTDLWEQWRLLLGKYPNDSDRGKQEARDFYLAHQREMDKGAVSAWPDGRPYYDLMIMLAVGGRKSFFAEMQNQPLTDEDRIFQYGTYKMMVGDDGATILVPETGHPAVRLLDCLFFGAVDPSLGTKSSDPSAIIILAKAPTGQMFVLIDDEQVRTPYTIIENMQAHHKVYPTMRFAIETVQFQALFATDAARESMRTGTYINFVQVPAKSNKQLRIESLEPPLKLHYILIPRFGAESLKAQMANWPNVSHDDGLDCLELVYRIASTYDVEETPNIVEGDSLIAGDGTLLSPLRDPAYNEAEALAYAREVAEAIEEEREPPKELWLPTMRY